MMIQYMIVYSLIIISSYHRHIRLLAHAHLAFPSTIQIAFAQDAQNLTPPTVHASLARGDSLFACLTLQLRIFPLK
jgi:hypothetical protein